MSSAAAPALRALRPALRAAPRALARRPLSTLPARPVASALGLRAAPRAAVPRLSSRLVAPSIRLNSTAAAPKPKSAYERFKELSKTYGVYAVLMYLAIGAVDFSLSFLLVHSMGASTIEPYFNKALRWYRVIRHGSDGADELEQQDIEKKAKQAAEEAAEIAANGGVPKPTAWYLDRALWAEAVLAYTIHKTVLLPFRAGLCVAWTPRVVEFLRARGWIGASGTKRAAQRGAEKIREASARVIDAAKRN
ncbi:Putative N-terminal acetyltransferase 2 [Vanrija pseudolonga]|uniref:N-terminal acetyltransferase 2 n=1 Tax=Vanrija pseudolonga TaxID=143232 RepID=A0AAF0YA68_9TREE|nr:Putative N-terminal acetyltransferase 2 [Vanrija pseudolonga]